MRRKCLILFALLLFFCRVFSQSTLYNVKHYTSSDGLPSSIVRDIAWDSAGFMWISTLKGIVRFDGVWMTAFTNKNYPGIKEMSSSPLITDNNGNSSYCDGIGNIYTLINYRPVLTDSSFVAKGGVNTLVFPLPDHFLPALFNAKETFFQPYNEPVLIDKEHFIITDNNQQLLLYDLASRSYTVLKKFSSHIKIFRLNNDVYLYEKGKAISVIKVSAEHKTLTEEKVDIGFNITASTEIFWRTGMTEPVIVENRSAYLLHRRDDAFSTELICDDLPNNIFIVNIKYNYLTHTTALATDGGGVYIYKRKLLNSYVLMANNVFASGHSFYTQTEVDSGQIWLPMDNLRLNLLTGKYYSVPASPSFTSAWRLKDSLVFFSGADSLISGYSFKTKRITKRAGIAKTESAAFGMTEGRLFCATENGIYEMTGRTDSVILQKNIIQAAVVKDNLSSWPRQMIEYRPGYLVICGFKGIFGFDIHSKRLDTLVSNRSKVSFRFITLFKGYLLACDYTKGIWVIKDKKTVQLPYDKAGYLHYAQSIFIDNSSNAWIAADAGIFRIKADSLIAQFNKRIPSAYLRCEYYGKEDGFDISELNGGRQGAMIELKNGTLSYAGINGIVNVDIISFNKDGGYPINIIADKLTVNNIEYPVNALTNKIDLPFDKGTIKFYFNIPSWKNPGSRVIKYYVSGYSDQWEELDYSKQNYIEFKNLRQGEHELRIIVSSLIDGKESAELLLTLNIATPWYRSTIFYIVIALLFLLSLFSVLKWKGYYLQQQNKNLARRIADQVQDISLQNNQLEKQKHLLEKQIDEMEQYQQRLEKDYALKNRLISIIGHDIITPLRFMNRAGKILLTKKESIGQKSFDDTLKTILDTGTGLQDMASNMLNWIKQHQNTMHFQSSDFNIHDQVNTIIEGIKPMADFKELYLVNNIPRGIVAHQFADPFKTIMLQLLTNAIKYSEVGSIIAEALMIGPRVQVVVIDEGVGMPADMIEHLTDSDKTTEFTSAHENAGHGFGFLIIKDLLKIMDGEIKIESRINYGTKVIISFPLRLAGKA